MTRKPLQTFENSVKIERPETVLVTPSGPTETRTVGGSAMTADADKYTDSGRTDNREQSDNWKSIGELARRIVGGK